MSFEDYKGADNQEEIAKGLKELIDEIGEEKLIEVFLSMKEEMKNLCAN